MRKAILIVYLAVICTACTLPTGSGLPKEEFEATAVKETIEAMGAQPDPQIQPADNNSSGNSNSGASADNPENRPVSTPTIQPTPTKVPTQASSGSQAKPLSLGNISTNVGEVFYGNCTAGEQTNLGVGVPITPAADVASAILWFEISNHTGSWGPFWLTMNSSQVGDYFAEINIGNEGPGTLANTGGWVNVWVEATDKDGKTYQSGYYSTNISYCQGGGVGQPPVGGPVINWFITPVDVLPNETVTLEWNISDASCGVFLDGMQVGPTDSYQYTVPAPQSAPASYAHQLVAYGGDCNNPTILVEDRTVAVVFQFVSIPEYPSPVNFSKLQPGPTRTITWTDRSDNEDGFRIYQNGALVATLGQNETSWTVGLNGYCGDEIEIDVVSFNSAGESIHYPTIINGPCPPNPPVLEKDSGYDTDTYFEIITALSDLAWDLYIDSALWIENTTQLEFDYPYSLACNEYVWITAVAYNHAGVSDLSNAIKIAGACP